MDLRAIFAAGQAQYDPFEHRDTIVHRLCREGCRESEAVVMADLFYGYTPGEYWKRKWQIYAKYSKPDNGVLWEEYIYAHPSSPIATQECKGTLEAYSAILKTWTYIFNNPGVSIDEGCERFATDKITARTIKGRMKKIANFRLENFGW